MLGTFLNQKIAKYFFTKLKIIHDSLKFLSLIFFIFVHRNVFQSDEGNKCYWRDDGRV